MASTLIAPVADALVASALGLSEKLVSQATAPGLAFALDQLGDIDIPDPVAARIDKAQLRALATLYLAADLEPAGIIPAVETLAGLAATGALQVDLGGALPLVEAWWRGRSERLADLERNAFFSRLFGTSSGPVSAEADRNFQFEDRMLELCESLYKLDELASGDPYGGLGQQARVRAGARSLAGNLGEASGGSTAFIAAEIVTTLREAFAIVGHASLRGAFAVRDLWGVVGAIGRIARKRFNPAGPYIRRGKAGMIILSWLAEVSEQLGDSGPIVQVGDPVTGSAIDWIEATLDIGEAIDAAAQAPASSRLPASAASPWSALGA